jgi:hypothetical protein
MDRRSLLLGVGAALAAPAVVRAESLMKVATVRRDVSITGNCRFFAEAPSYLSWSSLHVTHGTYYLRDDGVYQLTVEGGMTRIT